MFFSTRSWSVFEKVISHHWFFSDNKFVYYFFLSNLIIYKLFQTHLISETANYFFTFLCKKIILKTIILQSIWCQNLKYLIYVDSIFPRLLCHPLNQPFQPLRTCLVKFQNVIFCLAIDFQFSFTIKREILIVKCVNTDSNRPYVTGLTRKTFLCLKLMLRSTKSWCSRREKRNIVLIVSNCCKIC